MAYNMWQNGYSLQLTALWENRRLPRALRLALSRTTNIANAKW
ncbi:unnamed protein product [marine sediment metagenome]|uniref:Uncharacterized protein n=1 Tax=marine sediment metagenome TaxID=412755 RepID=X0T8Q7_9ZZZZ